MKAIIIDHDLDGIVVNNSDGRYSLAVDVESGELFIACTYPEGTPSHFISVQTPAHVFSSAESFDDVEIVEDTTTYGRSNS